MAAALLLQVMGTPAACDPGACYLGPTAVLTCAGDGAAMDGWWCCHGQAAVLSWAGGGATMDRGREVVLSWTGGTASSHGGGRSMAAELPHRWRSTEVCTVFFRIIFAVHLVPLGQRELVVGLQFSHGQSMGTRVKRSTWGNGDFDPPGDAQRSPDCHPDPIRYLTYEPRFSERR
jgi:hypothetical protein